MQLISLVTTPWDTLWRVVWNVSEWSGIGLGRFAPWVFHQCMGMYDCKQLDQQQEDETKAMTKRFREICKSGPF
jgi:hypothetical protein